MGESERLRLSDVRQVFRLVGDCRDLGEDRGRWVGRALAGIGEALDSRVVIGTFVPSPQLQGLGTSMTFWDVGWPDLAARGRWLSLIQSDRVARYATVRRSLADPGRFRVRTRDQLISDRAWYRSLEYNEDRAPLDQDDTLIAIDWPGGGPTARVFSVNRDVGQRRYRPRERRWLRLFAREVSLLAGSALAHEEAGPVAALPPRLRQVLDALAEGDSAKQVAARFGLSRHTVHDYIKDLHQRFDVSSRGQLLAFAHRHRPRLGPQSDGPI